MSIHDRDEDFVFIISQCTECIHLESIDELYCLAYPAGIPKTILFNERIYDKVLPDQEETIIWEKLEDMPPSPRRAITKLEARLMRIYVKLNKQMTLNGS
jgi:hypothetical protein